MKSFLGLGIELVRTMSIIQACLRYLLFPMSTLRSQRSVRMGLRSIDDPGFFPFHKILAQDMLVVVISVVFAVIAPLVLLPAIIFCLFSRIMWTHHHLYVYESVFETGGMFWPKIFRRFVFGLMIAQATITGQFILKEARHEAYATLVLMGLTYFFLRSTRRRYDQASYTLPLEVATVMDISLSQEQELPTTAAQHDVEQDKTVRFSNESSSDNTTCATLEESPLLGCTDPFEYAYVQPALRADSNARPEQPFPPAQLGREETFINRRDATTPSLQMIDETMLDTNATVRLKSLNREDRKLVDRWWHDQLQKSQQQHWLRLLIGEEGGTLVIGRRSKLVE